MLNTTLIHHQLVVVNDLERARDFYGRVVGLTEIKRPDTGRKGLWFGCLSNELHISLRADLTGYGPTEMPLNPGRRPGRMGRHVAFAMNGSLEEIAEHLDAEGISYEYGTAGLPQIFCEDPVGNFVEFNTGWDQEPVD